MLSGQYLVELVGSQNPMIDKFVSARRELVGKTSNDIRVRSVELATEFFNDILEKA
jgi:hypothetical protein